MKKNVHKKSLAWLVTACMLVALFPTTALADGLPQPTGLKLGVEKTIDPETGSEVRYSNTFTHLCLHWSKVASMEASYYSYEIETPMRVSGSSIVIPQTSSGSSATPHDDLFRWFTYNGESIDYTVDRITMAFRDGNGGNGPTAALNTSITVDQVESADRLTANYIGTETKTNGSGGSYHEATFRISGVPASHSVSFLFVNAEGNGNGTSASSSAGGVVEIKDSAQINGEPLDWYYSLGDMETGVNENYYLDVYSTDLVSDTEASMTITRYPIDIVFDSFDVTVGGGLTYTGSQVTPDITVRTMDSTPLTLTEDTHYEVSFEQNGAAISASEVKNAGTYTAVITGKTGTTYEGKVARKSFTIAKATPSYSAPTGLAAVYGQTLGNITLPAGFSWQDPASTPVGNVGTPQFNIKYTPSDTVNYNEVTGISVNISVTKANQNPALTLSSATGLVGLTPPALSVSGAGSTGAFHFVSSNPTVAAVDEATGTIAIVAAGTTNFTVSKDGDDNYNNSDASNSVALTVRDKVDLTVKDTAATDAAALAQLKNQGQINVGTPARVGMTNDFTIAISGKKTLETFAGGNTQEAKWIGLLIGNFKVNGGSANPITNLFYKISDDVDASYIQFSPEDVSASLQAGGTNPEFVYQIRSDVDPTKVIWLATSAGGANETKLTVNFTPYQAPSNNGGGGGGGTKTPVATTPETPKTSDTKGTTTVSTTMTASTNAQGTAKVSVPSETVAGLIDKAKAAEAQDKNAVIALNVKTDAKANAAEVTIDKASFDSIVKETKAGVKIETDMGSVTFDTKTLETIGEKSASGDISIQMKKLDAQTLPDSVKSAVGDRPIYDFAVMAGGNAISSFNGGTASINIPYTLKSGEDENAVVVYYVDDSGNLQTVRGAYNKETGAVEFEVSHFSKYAVGYNKVAFSDVSNNAWYSDAVTFLSARGITSGTSANTFSPAAAISRGEFLVMVMRAYGIEPLKNSADNFTDAGNTYYTDYLAAAKKLKITKGAGDNLYRPNEKISRQDMFTLLYRALDELEEIPVDTSSKVQFSDEASIAGYAETAVDTLATAGIVSGSNGKLDPKGISTRAQMAQILLNLLSK